MAGKVFKVLQKRCVHIVYRRNGRHNIINDYILRQLMDGKGARYANDTVNYVKQPAGGKPGNHDKRLPRYIKQVVNG